ncbi:M61 family metallopeptidase [Novosphingobium terrae]|uniref:M61 family metallopeptidase n=1 Tax=Novosphingobium terrae TaxID=2726189 RepID=UPI001F12FAEE|nr:peptidase M61 [Novosphingobium terrae]
MRQRAKAGTGRDRRRLALWSSAMVAALAAMLPVATPASAQGKGGAVSAPTLGIELTPSPAAAGHGQIGAIAVELRLGGLAIPAGQPVLRLPLVASNVDSIAMVLGRLDVRDAQGPLHLVARTVDLPLEAARDEESGGPSREWVADRATSGALTVRYNVPAEATLPPRGPAPPFAFSNDGQGASGAGHMFLLLPPGQAAYRTKVSWNLAALPKGAQGISSYGEGTVNVSEALTAGQLRMAYYMVGRIGIWPHPVPARGFFAAWQGQAPFDAEALMRWTGALYGHYASLFGQASPPPYGVFLRYNPINAGGGVGLYHSFVTTFGRAGGQGSDPEEVRITLAHEMFHTFQPYITQPAGLESSWFGEGLATFYQRRLPLRYGLITPEAFLRDLNKHAGRYYTSAMAEAPNSEVPKRFWADTRIRTLPYDRGMLYFATIDDAVRKRSQGKRSLDDLMLALLAKEKAGAALGNADWEALLQSELGNGAVDDFRAFLGGREPVPASDAFGPCFERTTRPMRRYELGFDSAVLAQTQRIVRGLIPGSAADRAGLRNGDEIVLPVPQDGIQGNQEEWLKLSIRREGRVFPLTYLPRGETVQAYQWQRVAGVSDDRCAL